MQINLDVKASDIYDVIDYLEEGNLENVRGEQVLAEILEVFKAELNGIVEGCKAMHLRSGKILTVIQVQPRFTYVAQDSDGKMYSGRLDDLKKVVI